MKQLKFFTILSVAASMLLLSSCNSNTNEPATITDTTAKKETPPLTTTPGGLASIMTIKHKVANFATWKAAYDEHDSNRVASGLHNYVIARGIEDSNMVMVALKMDDANKAKQFAAMPELKERMKKGGVIEPVTIDYKTTVMNDTTAIQQTVRLMVTHKVKDWDTWKKAFDSDKQARMDAGFTDRVVGYTVGDNHNVTIVLSVADMDKAKTFMNSKGLKDKMKEGGVEGPPTFFFYRIAQKY